MGGGSGLVVRLIGPPRVELDGLPVLFDNRKAAALLAFLALEGRAHQRDSLAALLWPEADRPHARGALRRVLASLKAAIGPGWLEVEQESLGLRTGMRGLWIDVEQFRRNVAACRGHDHAEADPCATGCAAMADALNLYRGDFLQGFTLRDSPEFDTWQSARAEGLRLAALGALQRLVRYHVAHGSWEEAMGYARRCLALDPLCEAAQRHLMQLYAWRGERGLALRQYKEYVRLLAEELDTRPMAETMRLAEAIRGDRLPPPAPARYARNLDVGASG